MPASSMRQGSGTKREPAGWNGFHLMLALLLGASLHVAYLEYLERASLLSIVREDNAAELDHGSNSGNEAGGKTNSRTVSDPAASDTSASRSISGRSSSSIGGASHYRAANGRPIGWPGQHKPGEPGNSGGKNQVASSTAEWPIAADAGLFQELVDAKSAIDWSPVVADQLIQWKDTGYTQKQVDEYCVRKVVVASFVKNEFRIQSFAKDHKNMHRLRCGFWLMKAAAIRAAARGKPIPDIEVAVLSGDSAFSLVTPPKRWDDAGPLLSNIKCGDASVSFPLTLHDMFGSGDGEMGLALYAKRFEQALEWSGSKQWGSLENVAFFSAGGGAVTRGNRSHLFQISKSHGKYLNSTPHARGMDVMSDFRYNVYAYGHCGWSRRIKELAMLRTVVLVEDSSCREYVHGLFEPNVDHLPVKEDFSDLVERMEAATPAAKTFDGDAMADLWMARGQEMLTLTSTLDYVELLMRELAKLQRFTPQYHPDWKEYTFDRGRLWFGSLKPMNASKCKKPAFRSRPRTHKC